MEDNRPINKKGQAHGLWEAYYYMYGTLWYKLNYINGNVFGLYQYFNHEGKLLESRYYAR
jgi:antitoxin component YwqK of YwqJK toxin-antitoxin module